MARIFDRVADIYDETRRMPHEVLAGIMENVRSEIDPASGPLIELGIGTGRIALPLADAGFRVVGIDMGEKMLVRLRENIAGKSDAGRAIHPIRSVRGDVSMLPFAVDSFGGAISIHVFHLLDDMRSCIEETRRVLAPGGCLLFGGEQRLLRYIEQALDESFVDILVKAGVKLPDQAEVERQVVEHVGGMGGDIKLLDPVEWDFEISSGDVVERIEKRVASYLWDVPEDVLRELADRLRTLYAERVGPPSTMITFRRSFRMFCARFGS
jgi:ubiquinone/menaquinone biosynthesis C-methylase UbiE